MSTRPGPRADPAGPGPAGAAGPLLPRDFFARPALAVAGDLLGCVLAHQTGAGLTAVMLTEVEAYEGAADPASHAYRGQTARNAVMFGEPGHAYVYFTYGMHFCLNVVTEDEGTPGAVLIRGLDGIADANGPARLCRALGLDLRHNGLDLTRGAPLWLERGRPRASEHIVQTVRVGIRHAADLPWRFYVAGSNGVSRRDRGAETAHRRARDHRFDADGPAVR